MTLKKYIQKRDFSKTTEPHATKIKKSSVKNKRNFVVQKHAARQLHYDFRLEIDGVLKSWAVPKGPSVDPTIKRLAVHVEDHPLEYGSFEGIIPKGQYGGGTVMVWDRGEWVETNQLEKGYEKGHLSFYLKGQKLRGAWDLIQMKNDPQNWLLIKAKDEFSYSEKKNPITNLDTSVISGDSMDEIEKKANSKNKKKKKKEKSQEKNKKKSTIRLSHPDKILFSEAKVTKQDLAHYYEEIQSFILPLVINRPLAIVRCPSGDKGNCFFQKHLNKKNDDQGLLHVCVKEKNKTINGMFIKDLDGLIELAQMGTLEIHAWGARIDRLDRPDMVTFDLDPDPNISWKKMVDTAFMIREYLQELGLVSFLKTTGGKGLHITAPIKRLYEWEDVMHFAKAFSHSIVSQYPSDYVATMTKSKRKGKIFIDYFRNNRGSTAIIPYSTRANPKGTIAIPLRWDELNTKLKSDKYHLKNVLKRLNVIDDPWKDFYLMKQKLPKIRQRRLYAY